MSHALTPSFPILNSHMDFYPLCFFTYTLIPSHLASFTMTPIPLLALYTHFITPTLTTNYLHIPLQIHTFIPPSSCHAKLLQFRWDSVEIKVGTSKVTGDLNSWV